MPPVASRYCYCVARRDLNTLNAISISGDWARCGSRGGQLYHYYRKYGTQWFSQKDINNEWFSGVCQEPLLPSSMVPPPAAPVTSPHMHAVEGTPIRRLLRNTIYRLRMRIQQWGGGCENTTPTDSDGCTFSGPGGGGGGAQWSAVPRSAPPPGQTFREIKVGKCVDNSVTDIGGVELHYTSEGCKVVWGMGQLRCQQSLGVSRSTAGNSLHMTTTVVAVVLRLSVTVVA
ncbi:hypothetical protein GWK47_008407 [Chionoecetes opilio]|uniref:Uncharacterized protein n=1 Tax=Chionoecetes opilio TaxID=41210 RepID=A0A8J4Y574_CHIOP|nr:hypothetical protein GWK47_008407 [Chionoecetes opilio]